MYLDCCPYHVGKTLLIILMPIYMNSYKQFEILNGRQLSNTLFNQVVKTRGLSISALLFLWASFAARVQPPVPAQWHWDSLTSSVSLYTPWAFLSVQNNIKIFSFFAFHITIKHIRSWTLLSCDSGIAKLRLGRWHIQVFRDEVSLHFCNCFNSR